MASREDGHNWENIAGKQNVFVSRSWRCHYDLVKEKVLHSSSRGSERMPKGQSMDGLLFEGTGWIRTPKGEMAHSGALIRRTP